MMASSSGSVDEVEDTAAFILRETTLATLNMARGLKDKLDSSSRAVVRPVSSIGGKVLTAELEALELHLTSASSTSKQQRDDARAHAEKLRTELAEERAKHAALTTAVTELRHELAQVEKSQAASEAAAEVLRAQLAHAHAIRDASATEAGELRAELEALRREYADASTNAEQLRAELDAVRAREADLSRVAAGWRTAAEPAQRHGAETQAAAESVRAELDAVRTQLATAVSVEAELRAALDSARQEGVGVTGCVEGGSSNAHTAGAGALIAAEPSASTSELRAALAKAQRSHAESMAGAEVLRLELAATRARHAELASELAAAGHAAKRGSDDALRAELVAACAKESAASLAAAELRSELDALRRSHADSVSALGALRAELSATQRTAAAELAAERERHARALSAVEREQHGAWDGTTAAALELAEMRTALATLSKSQGESAEQAKHQLSRVLAELAAEREMRAGESESGALAERLRTELAAANERQASIAAVVDELHHELQRTEQHHARQLAAAHRGERAALACAERAERELGRLRAALEANGSVVPSVALATRYTQCSPEPPATSVVSAEQRVIKRVLVEATARLLATREHSEKLALQLARANAELSRKASLIDAKAEVEDVR